MDKDNTAAVDFSEVIRKLPTPDRVFYKFKDAIDIDEREQI